MGLFSKATRVRSASSGASAQQPAGGDKTEAVTVETAAREASVDKDAVLETQGDKEETPQQEAEDESKYPTGPKLWMLVTGLCLAIWVVALDNTIIATASKSSNVDCKYPSTHRRSPKDYDSMA